MQNADAESLKYTISGSISVILVMIREMLLLIPVNREFWFLILVNCAQDPPPPLPTLFLNFNKFSKF